jgi:OOP family OmpA-OmpF porin
MKLTQLAMAALLLPLALTSQAAGLTYSVDVGQDKIDSKSVVTGQKLDKDTSMVYGLSGGYRFDNGFGAELDYQHVNEFKVLYQGVVTNKDKEDLIAADGYYAFNKDGVFQPYVLLGLGDYIFKNDFGFKVETLLGNAGLGAFVKLNDNWALRGELRNAHSFGDKTYNDRLMLVGLTYAMGYTKPMAAEPAPVAPAPEPAPVVAAPPPAPMPAAPADSDNDGVADTADKCPNTPAGVQVDGNGCPLDADADGVADYLDKCPNTPAGVQVDSTGCPLDADADGVADYLDKCPNTPAGAVVDATGCPKVVTTPIKQEINVQFDNGKSVIKPEYKAEVEKVANMAKQYPTAFIEIQGYTDNKGSAKKNVKLSQERANAVRDSLVHDFNVDPSHVTSKGYGPANPVADNKTEAGRAKNRHVTAVLSAEQKKMEMGAPKPAGHHHAHKAAAPATH